jgi:site-specific recombinase XerD
MQNFYHWLKRNKFAESSITQHIANIKRFTAWTQAEGHADIAHLRYQDILAFVQHEKSKNIETATVNNSINSISKYYEYLKKEGLAEKNPAGKIRIKGAVKKVIRNQFSYKELEALYKEYVQFTEQNPPAHILQKYARQRNITMLSLMIWQGLHSGELKKLKTADINLNTGTIYIASSLRSNSRELKLESHQVILLHNYLTQIRPQQKPKADEFFTGIVHNINLLLVKELTALNPRVNNANQIRASVIMYWLRLYDKRQVQYMAGHRYVSSVENYQQQDIETLTDQLKKYHPFG